MENLILVCSCSSVEHQIVFSYDDEDNLLYAQIHLTHYSFWKRLVKGIKYIFGYKCRYGHWDEFLFSSEHAQDLKYLANLLERNQHPKGEYCRIKQETEEKQQC
jgi:hypothetical protein